MLRHRKSLAALLIAGLIVSGCSTPSTTTVTEYRPRVQKLDEGKAPAEGVFQLVRWTPIAAVHPSTQPIASAKPAPQMPVEVEQVYVRRHQPIGFRRNGDQLLAIADQTTKPLVEAHYEWRTVPGQSPGNSNAGARSDQIRDVVLIVIGVAIIGGLAFWILHDNRHGTYFNSSNDH
jgi:hypothetical protein